MPELVAGRVRDGILDGTFARPGAQLAEAELATQLGVSRGPVREALQRLIHEGLVTAERNRGVFVVELDVSDARDVYFLREVIEQAAASRLARLRGRQGVLGELTAVVDRMERMTDAPWGDLVDIDLEFHRTLVSRPAARGWTGSSPRSRPRPACACSTSSASTRTAPSW